MNFVNIAVDEQDGIGAIRAARGARVPPQDAYYGPITTNDRDVESSRGEPGTSPASGDVLRRSRRHRLVGGVFGRALEDAPEGGERGRRGRHRGCEAGQLCRV